MWKLVRILFLPYEPDYSDTMHVDTSWGTSHKIRRIEALASFPIVFIAIKLCVVSGAPVFFACGFVYIRILLGNCADPVAVYHTGSLG